MTASWPSAIFLRFQDMLELEMHNRRKRIEARNIRPLSLHQPILLHNLIPNRDIFTGKELWRVFCSEFELEDHGGFDVAKMMNDGMGDVWDEIVEKYRLVKTNLDDVTRFEAFRPVTNLKFQHVCSMNKSREFGFSGYCNTLKSVRYWIKRMREMKIIP